MDRSKHVTGIHQKIAKSKASQKQTQASGVVSSCHFSKSRFHLQRHWGYSEQASVTYTTNNMHRDSITTSICKELDRAYSKHGREQWGRHEFYAILKKEVDELWDTIKSDAAQEELRKEAIQVAAMVFRYLETGDRYRDII